MKRILARLATVAVAVPFAVGMIAGGAQAEPITATVPGCWGAGVDSAIVCNLTISAEGPAPTIGVMYVKACAGTCHNVPVQWVEPGTQTADICYAYTDGAGNPRSGCAAQWLPQTVGITPTFLEIFGCNSSTESLCAYQ